MCLPIAQNSNRKFEAFDSGAEHCSSVSATFPVPAPLVAEPMRVALFALQLHDDSSIWSFNLSSVDSPTIPSILR